MSRDSGQGERSAPSPARVGSGASEASDARSPGTPSPLRAGRAGERRFRVGTNPIYHLPSAALGTLEFTLLFDADNSTLHCTAHRAKVMVGVGVPGPRV